MTLVLTEEQRLLKNTAHDFLAANAPVAQLRELRDSRDALGYATGLWREMAELGWAGIIVPEQYGGLEFGFAGLGAVLEETGRTLTASPLLSTAALGASALLLAGDTAQKEAVLPGLAAGDLTLALALEESNHHDPLGVALTAAPVDGGFVLNGSKRFVVDGHSADHLIVVARTAGKPGDIDGLSLFLVAAETPGVDSMRTIMVDGRNAANIAFDGVALDSDALLGELNAGWSILEPVLDRGRVALAAEMLGSCREAFERTVAYLKEREQFGVKIGSFQALQHRAALMFIELELCQSVVMQALSAVDKSPEQLPLLASLAKTRLNETARLITNEAVQMHGGIGVTDEFEIGFFLKRARVAMQWLGDSGYHRDRYAKLSGY
jgi:acyl-CoA dehydrogenase